MVLGTGLSFGLMNHSYRVVLPENEILSLMPGHVYGDICTPSFIYIHYIPKDDTRLNIRGHQPF